MRAFYYNILFLLISMLILQGCSQGTTSSSDSNSNIQLGETSRDFDGIKQMVAINGKLAFIGTKGNKQFVVEDQKEVEYDYVQSLQDVGGKLAYIAKKSGKTFVVYNGNNVVETEGLAANLIAVNGKPAVQLIEKNNNQHINYDGRIFGLGKEYDSIQFPTDIGGKLVYIGSTFKNGKNIARVIMEGQEISSAFDDIREIIDIDGKPVFTATENWKSVLIFGNKIASQQYDSIMGLYNAGGKPAFIAFNKGSSNPLVVYDGREMGPYDYVEGPLGYHEKVIFGVVKSGKSFIIYDGKEFGKEYDSASSPQIVEGKLAFVAKKGQETFIVYDMSELKVNGYTPKGYTITTVGDKLAYIASKDGKDFVIYKNSQIGPFDEVKKPLIDLGGKLAFIGIKNGKEGIFTEK